MLVLRGRMLLPADDVSRLLSLLYAGPGSAVCRMGDGHLEVVPADQSRGDVLLTKEELLERGVEALLGLASGR